MGLPGFAIATFFLRFVALLLLVFEIWMEEEFFTKFVFKNNSGKAMFLQIGILLCFLMNYLWFIKIVQKSAKVCCCFKKKNKKNGRSPPPTVELVVGAGLQNKKAGVKTD